MGNEAGARKSAGVEDAREVEAIVRRMAKRSLPELEVKRVTNAATEGTRAEEAMEHLLRANFLEAARIGQEREAPTGAASK